jgi:hypothetical protein
MTIGENIQEFWSDLSGGHKLLVVATALVIGGALVFGFWGWAKTAIEVRRYEQQASIAKEEARVALETAAKIGKEKLEAERKLAETEAKRDGKITELEKAKIDTLDARVEYLRAVREPRGDTPSPEQLCRELAALGHPC